MCLGVSANDPKGVGATPRVKGKPTGPSEADRWLPNTSTERVLTKALRSLWLLSAELPEIYSEILPLRLILKEVRVQTS